jgi:molybdate transport system substrate-binding protein
MSYRRAWNLIQEINTAAGETLVKASTGGVEGGGTKLTPRGRAAVDIYEQVRQSLVESAAGVLQRTVTDGGPADAALHVAAAISLQEAVGQILAEFALQQPGTQVRTIFGASNELADHLLAGAPGDVFLSADPDTLDRLESANRLVVGSRRTIAQNGLAVIARPRMAALSSISSLLNKRFKQIALAEPACPLGHYSKSYLTKAGIYDELLPRVLHVDNSRAVLAAVASGFADAGVAFSSDAVRARALRTVLKVPTSQVSASYVAAITASGRAVTDADHLLDFLSSASARRCLRRCGFRVPKA